MAGKTVRFAATIEDGHKGAAVIVPFDPVELWSGAWVPVWSDVYGNRSSNLAT